MYEYTFVGPVDGCTLLYWMFSQYFSVRLVMIYLLIEGDYFVKDAYTNNCSFAYNMFSTLRAAYATSSLRLQVKHICFIIIQEL